MNQTLNVTNSNWNSTFPNVNSTASPTPTPVEGSWGFAVFVAMLLLFLGFFVGCGGLQKCRSCQKSEVPQYGIGEINNRANFNTNSGKLKNSNNRVENTTKGGYSLQTNI